VGRLLFCPGWGIKYRVFEAEGKGYEFPSWEASGVGLNGIIILNEVKDLQNRGSI